MSSSQEQMTDCSGCHPQGFTVKAAQKQLEFMFISSDVLSAHFVTICISCIDALGYPGGDSRGLLSDSGG